MKMSKYIQDFFIIIIIWLHKWKNCVRKVRFENATANGNSATRRNADNHTYEAKHS